MGSASTQPLKTLYYDYTYYHYAMAGLSTSSTSKNTKVGEIILKKSVGVLTTS